MIEGPMKSNAGALPVAVVVGAGPGIGQALARRFAKAGYAVALLARDLDKLNRIAAEIPSSRAYMCDVGNAQSIKVTFAAIRDQLGEVDVLLYNAGSGVFADIEEISPEQFEAAWRVNALGALLCSKEVFPEMKRRRAGSIVFTGATASRRGNVHTAAFAPAKAAQRSLAESMARALWPYGVHVSILILDGLVGEASAEDACRDMTQEALIDPRALADTVMALMQQDPRAWSFEVEVRPSAEKW